MGFNIVLLHPFDAQAIGLNFADLLKYHSKCHELALGSLESREYRVRMDYFSIFPYKFTGGNGVKKFFWPITNVFPNDRHKWRKQYSFLHYIYNFLWTPDLTIINMSGHGSPYIFKLGKLLVKKRKPYIAMIGGVNMSKSKDALKYFTDANHLIVHTETQKKELLTYQEYKDLEIKVIPLGIDTNIFKPDFITKNFSKLLFVGRITRIKRVEIAIQSVSYLIGKGFNNIHLDIIGPVSDVAYFDELQELIKDLNIENKVNYLGSLNHENLVEHYQKAALLLLPSLHESFGMVMIESMACGTPVVAFSGANGPDEIINGANGKLADRESFNRVVEAILADPQEFENLSKGAVSYVENNMNIKLTTKLLMNSIKLAIKQS